MNEEKPSFEKWHKANLIQLLEFMENREYYRFHDLLKQYREWLRGN